MENLTLSVSKNAEIVDYTTMELTCLTERIAEKSDKKALDELHQNRALFRFKGSRPLVMVDFLLKLKTQPQAKRWCNNDQMTIEKAFDLTLSKFFNLPDDFNGEAETCGPDCRCYYKAYNRHVASKLRSIKLTDKLEIEFMAAKTLQNFVFRHFYLSCLECKRGEQKLTRRICYSHNGKNMYFWIPSVMTSKMFKTWFANNITNGLCQTEIQKLIDSSFFRGKIVSLDDIDQPGLQNNGSDFGDLLKEQITVDGLAATVADEKADNISEQRPAIKTLGKTALRKLVLQIFESLSQNTNNYQKILKDFGLSKATFSRFAGSRWKDTNNVTKQTIPDLWKNTAHILVNHPDFLEAVRSSCLWEKVNQAAES